jgi:hypothetical protein
MKVKRNYSKNEAEIQQKRAESVNTVLLCHFCHPFCHPLSPLQQRKVTVVAVVIVEKHFSVTIYSKASLRIFCVFTICFQFSIFAEDKTSYPLPICNVLTKLHVKELISDNEMILFKLAIDIGDLDKFIKMKN